MCESMISAVQFAYALLNDHGGRAGAMDVSTVSWCFLDACLPVCHVL
jgi:hypothetical protein